MNTEKLENILETMLANIRQAVVQKGMDRIALTYLLTRDIPNSVKHFFDQEVELWLREESKKFTSSERFDYDLPEVQVLLDKIFDILKQTASFSLNQFNRLLERAIKLEANYLIRPHQTLTQFLFKDSPIIRTMDVYDMLKYFDKFEYYKDALTDYFNLKYLQEISEPQFRELIEGIDRQVYSNRPVETVLQTVKTIVNFLNQARPPQESIPIDILITALRDRKLDEFAALIERQQQEGTTALNLADLEAILTEKRTLGEIRARGEKVSLEQIKDIETEKPEVEVEAISISETHVLPQPEREEPEELEELEEEEQDEPVTAADQLAEVMASKLRGETLEDLHNLITPRQRKRFIKKLFRKKESNYKKFVDQLNRIAQWKKASILIDEYFYQAGINPYSKEALEFTDLVYNRYFPKDMAMQSEKDVFKE